MTARIEKRFYQKNVDDQEDQNGDEEKSIHQIPDKEDQDEYYA